MDKVPWADDESLSVAGQEERATEEEQIEVGRPVRIEP